MPNILRKLYWLFCAGLLYFSQPVLAQSPAERLQEADSLYTQHHYTQALEIYEQLLTKTQFFTPQMLLKMAYIQEGLQHYTQSMYYLQLYYSKNPSRSVLRKMEEVGLQQQLTGYKYTDWDFFKTQFYKYYATLLEILLLVAAAFMTFLLLGWFRRRPATPQWQTVFLLYLGFVFYFANFLTLGRQGIIKTGNVPIMTAPSAGAEMIAMVDIGHKVAILGEEDIWYRIEWQDQTAYIRKFNLLLLPQPLGKESL